MEKRLVLFIIVSVIIFTGYGLLRVKLLPPPPAQQAKDVNDKQAAAGKPDGTKPADTKPADKPSKENATKQDVATAQTPDTKKPAGGLASKGGEKKGEKKVAKTPAKHVLAAAAADQRWATLGSFAPDSPYRLLVTLTNKGAAIERVELVDRRSNGKLRYRDLERTDGYLGIGYRNFNKHIEVTSVGPGTPGAVAKPADPAHQPGLKSGDRVVSFDGQTMQNAVELTKRLARTHPGQSVRLKVQRGAADTAETIEFAVQLVARPLELIRTESSPGSEPVGSFLLGLAQLGDTQAQAGEDELTSLDSLRDATWQLTKSGPDTVEFRQQIDGAGDDGLETEMLEIVKRYRLVAAVAEAAKKPAPPKYHLQLQIEVHNKSQQPQTVAYYLDGPNGLPTEGWWYANKIHPSWGSAGARDVIWRVHEQKHSLRSASQIFKDCKKDPDHSVKMLLSDTPAEEDRTLDYLGVDTQYFSAVLLEGPVNAPTPFVCRQAYAMPVGPVPDLSGREVHLLNTSFRLASTPSDIAPGTAFTKNYHIFLGPKAPPLLEQYGLDDIIEYGWFGFIAQPLSKLLHWFYFVVRNYGLAIILLTILVRGAMFPIGRKAARNAQIMQELAPQLKALKEKYKNDMEKQAQAQRELWKKHNFNPLGGCWLMFLQLPIFIGLYRCLSVDIELRQAALIPGLHWCSNLAGPDMFWYWEGIGFPFLTGPNGWLGPYFNLLPIVTVILFIVQQKMFTPPATDDQSRMQQSMMKYMMIFMGVMFFKVASGLCLYFIASSLWGIAERKLLPKTDVNKDNPPAPAPTGKAAAATRGGGRPARGSTPPAKKASLLERIEQWQRLAEQRANQRNDKSRDDDRPRGKRRRKP